MFRAILPLSLAAALAGLCQSALAQSSPNLHPHTIPAPSSEPTAPPARTVQDTLTHITFNLPAGWALSRADGDLSTFRLDARSAPRRAQLRAVAAIAFNPYPRSTFSGALFYLSLTPQSTPADCLAQAANPSSASPNTPHGPAGVDKISVGDTAFTRGHDAHGKICTEARDTIYTALRHGTCIRFDLAINSFCGGEVSGAQDLTEPQLQAIQQRLESILQTVRFTAR